MKANIVESLKALTKLALRWDGETFVTIPVNPTGIVRDNQIIVSAEDGLNWADYYGELRGGYPWIDPVLEKFAADNKMFWEWNGPGSISLWDC